MPSGPYTHFTVHSPIVMCGCEECGSMVFDQPKHECFHGRHTLVHILITNKYKCLACGRLFENEGEGR